MSFVGCLRTVSGTTIANYLLAVMKIITGGLQGYFNKPVSENCRETIQFVSRKWWKNIFIYIMKKKYDFTWSLSKSSKIWWWVFPPFSWKTVTRECWKVLGHKRRDLHKYWRLSALTWSVFEEFQPSLVEWNFIFFLW